MPSMLRHPQVGDDQAVIALDQASRASVPSAAVSTRHVEVAFQQMLQAAAHDLTIFDDQDCAVAPPPRPAASLFWRQQRKKRRRSEACWFLAKTSVPFALRF